MFWSHFKQANRRLANQPPAPQAPFFPGSYYSDGTNSVYLYRPTIRERISILIFGNVWLTMKLGKDIAPAMLLRGQKTVFEKPAAVVPMVAKTSCKFCHGTGSEGQLQGREIPCRCLKEKELVINRGHRVINNSYFKGGSKNGN